MSNKELEDKEKELEAQFNKFKSEATEIEGQIHNLQKELEKRMTNMTRIQGAFAVIQELKTAPVKATSPKS